MYLDHRTTDDKCNINILQTTIYLLYLDIEDMEHQNHEKKKVNMNMLKSQIYIMKKKLVKFQNIKG